MSLNVTMSERLARIQREAFTSDELRRQLPEVGDILKKRPYVDQTRKIECKVTFVNEDALWYEVEFLDPTFPFKESYKLPEI